MPTYSAAAQLGDYVDRLIHRSDADTRFWQEVVAANADELYPPTIARIARYAAGADDDLDIDNGNCVLHVPNQVIARHFIALWPELAARVEDFREELTDVFQPESQWEFLWKINNAEDVAHLKPAEMEILLAALAVVPRLAELTDQSYTRPQTLALPLPLIAQVKRLDEKFKLHEQPAVQEAKIRKEVRTEIDAISTRLNFIESRLREIPQQADELRRGMKDSQAVYEPLTPVVMGGPLNSVSLQFAHELLMGPLYTSEITSLDENHTMRPLYTGKITSLDQAHADEIKAALAVIDFDQGGAEVLPDDGLTNFAPKKAAQDHKKFVVKALQTDKGMTQFLTFITWSAAVARWKRAGKKLRELYLEEERLKSEHAHYHG